MTDPNFMMPGSLVETPNGLIGLVVKAKIGERLVWFTQDKTGEAWNKRLWLYTEALTEVKK